MPLARVVVFLPCYSLDDFPTWLDDREADELLAHWTAAWDPRLIAATEKIPEWASVDVHPQDGDSLLGLVPPQCDERFEVMAAATGLPGSQLVRQAQGRDAIVAEAVAKLRHAQPENVPLREDFHALGLAWLLSELLARRMRSSMALGATNFAEAAVAAARASVVDDEPAAREKLQECFDVLAANRGQYYPVDFWLLDLVLLAESTLGPRLVQELDAPTPLAFVAAGQVIEALAQRDPALLAQMRARLEEGSIEIVGGRYDSTPLDWCSLATIRESFARGQAAYREHLGAAPCTYGQCTGGSSAFLPGILVELGYTGAIWTLFDGTPLPDMGTSRIRWQGEGKACIDAVARPPLDARKATTILALADKIGDALDHDHTAVIQFAHYAGTASPWFDTLRRIGGWTTALGTFVTPQKLFAATTGAGMLADFAPDAFHPALPDEQADAAADPLGDKIAAARNEARRLAAAEPAIAAWQQALAAPAAAAAAPPTSSEPALWQRVTRGLFGDRDDDAARLSLENEWLRLRVNPKTGGLLSLRSVKNDRGNQLSQQLALRTTRPLPPPGSAWEDAQERADYSSMAADRIVREGSASIVSTGRLVDAEDREVGTFTQRISLVPARPLALLDIDLTVPRAGVAGPAFEAYTACRFAWNENDDIDLCRSLHAEPIVTERSRFTSPHFLALKNVASRADDVFVATGGLPWSLRSAPHMVDLILLAGSRQAGRFRLAVGLGIESPREVALALMANGPSTGTAG
jgi:alpha-mannosidase